MSKTANVERNRICEMIWAWDELNRKQLLRLFLLLLFIKRVWRRWNFIFLFSFIKFNLTNQYFHFINEHIISISNRRKQKENIFFRSFISFVMPITDTSIYPHNKSFQNYFPFFLFHPHSYGSPLFVCSQSLTPSLSLFVNVFFIQPKSIPQNKHTTQPTILTFHSWMLFSFNQGKYCLEIFLIGFQSFETEYDLY